MIHSTTCTNLKQYALIQTVPVLWYGGLFIPELTRSTLMGELTDHPLVLNSLLYFLGATAAVSFIFFVYGKWPRWYVLGPMVVLAPFIGVELFFVGLSLADFFANQGAFASLTEEMAGWLLLAPLLLLADAWYLLLALCPATYFILWRIKRAALSPQIQQTGL